MVNIDSYKLEDASKVKSLETKLNLIDDATEKTTKDLNVEFKKAVEGLDNKKLATLLDKQFKDGDKYKSVDVMQADDTYTFLVQTALDAMSSNGRYENLLRGKDDKYGIDDEYGRRTKAAVSQFQRDVGIAEDGVVGPETMAKIVGVLNGTVTVDITKEQVKDADVYVGKAAETPTKDLSQRTTEGILTVDAYGNKVIYVDSKDKIPSDNFNKPEFGANVYVYKGFRIYGNGRVMNLTTSEMFDWKDLDAKIATNSGINAPASAKTDTVPTVSKEKINKDIYNVVYEDIKNLFVGKQAAETYKQITKDDKEVLKFLQDNTIVTYNTANPNIVINYHKKNVGYPTFALPSINVNSILKNDILDKDAVYSQLHKSIVDQVAKNKETERKANIQKNYNDAVTKIRGKKWTLDQLFPDKKDSKTYQGYFKRFENNAVTIDPSATYTRLQNNKLIFDLDESGAWDASYSKNKSIDMTLITNAEGKLDDTKFITQIKKIVVDAVESFKKDV